MPATAAKPAKGLPGSHPPAMDAPHCCGRLLTSQTVISNSHTSTGNWSTLTRLDSPAVQQQSIHLRQKDYVVGCCTVTSANRVTQISQHSASSQWRKCTCTQSPVHAQGRSTPHTERHYTFNIPPCPSLPSGSGSSGFTQTHTHTHLLHHIQQ